MEKLGWQLHLPRDALASRKQEVTITARVIRIGRYVLSVVYFGKGESRKARGHVVSASYFGSAFPTKRPNLSNGVFIYPTRMTVRISSSSFSARKAVTQGDALDGCLSDPRNFVVKFHVNWGHASEQQSRRVLADPVGGNLHLLTCAGEVVEQREVFRSFDKAPRDPIAGTSTAAMFNEKFLADLLVLGDCAAAMSMRSYCGHVHCAIAAHAMGVFSKFPLLIPVRTRNPQCVWVDFRNSWIGVICPPQLIQFDEGGEWKSEVRTELRSERRMKLLFQGVVRAPGFSNAVLVLREEFIIS